MRKRTLWLLAALAAITLGTLTFIACGGDGPSAPNPVSEMPSTPTAAAPAPATPTKTVDGTSGVCAGKQIHTTPNGALGYCVLDTNLLVSQCGQYIDPDQVDRVYKKIGIVAPGGGYTRTAIYHEPKTGKNKYDCGATESEPGADPENNGKNFKDGDIIEFWRPVARDACGRDQWDGDLRDHAGNRLDFLGYVLNYPKDCSDSCEDVNVQFGFCPEASIVAPTVSQCFSGSWVNPGTGTLAYGDSASDSVGNPFTKSHAYTQTDSEQTLTATLTVVRDKLSCPKTLTVKIPPRRKSCDDYQKPAITGDIGSDIQETQVVFDSGTVGPSGGTFNPTLPQTVARPAYGLPPGSFSTTYTLPYGPVELKCETSKTFTKPVPPQEKKECRLTIAKDVDKTDAKDNDYLIYTLVVSNEGDDKCTGGGVLVEDQTPQNVDYVTSSGTVGQCHWQGPIKWNCGTLNPGASIKLWWKGKVDNPRENCNDFVIKNKASGWSDQTKTIWSNEVSTTVDITCGPTCPPASTTTSVNWSNLLESQFGNNPKCSDFGLESLSKKETGLGQTWYTDRSAAIIIVKDGQCNPEGPNNSYYSKKVSPNDASKWIGSGIKIEFSCEGKKKDLSHVEFCGCPVPGASAAFDPYFWDGGSGLE